MTNTDAFPPTGWRVDAVPSNWDPSDGQLHVQPVTLPDFSNVPPEFFMTIQTKEMLAESLVTAIIVNFRATSQGAVVRNIAGVGTDWVRHLGEVAAAFPTNEWASRAVDLVNDFLRKPEVREEVSPHIAKIPRRGPDAAVATNLMDVGVQRRRKITPEHLNEVARIYNAAQEINDPPTRAVQHHFGVSHSTAAKWVGAARQAGMLPRVEVLQS